MPVSKKMSPPSVLLLSLPLLHLWDPRRWSLRNLKKKTLGGKGRRGEEAFAHFTWLTRVQAGLRDSHTGKPGPVPLLTAPTAPVCSPRAAETPWITAGCAPDHLPPRKLLPWGQRKGLLCLPFSPGTWQSSWHLGDMSYGVLAGNKRHILGQLRQVWQADALQDSRQGMRKPQCTVCAWCQWQQAAIPTARSKGHRRGQRLTRATHRSSDTSVPPARRPLRATRTEPGS